MTIIAVMATIVMTFLISFPALLVGAVFVELIGQPVFDMVWGPGLGLIVGIAFTSVIPGLLVGATAGGLGMWLARKAFAEADWGATALGAAVIVVTYAVVAPMVLSGVSWGTLLIEATAAVTAYLVVAGRAMDEDDTRRGWFKAASQGLMVLAVAECFFMPVVTVSPLEASEDVPVFQPLTESPWQDSEDSEESE